MRRTVQVVGFVKEAHYRSGWPTRNGRLLDAVGYALLRTDWRDGTTTPVDWNEEPDALDGPAGVSTTGVTDRSVALAGPVGAARASADGPAPLSSTTSTEPGDGVKRCVRTLVAAGSVALLAGCGPTDPVSGFVEAARSGAPGVSADMSDAGLVDFGNAVCDRIEDDGTTTLVLLGDQDPDEVAAINQAARRYLC